MIKGNKNPVGVGSEGIAKLAEFFPEAIRMRMPVRVIPVSPSWGNPSSAPTQRLALVGASVVPDPNFIAAAGDGDPSGSASGVSEATVIEFGTEQEVLFFSSLPLEFEDRIRLQNSDGSLDAEAKIVAVQLGDGKKVVAARFTRKVANWIIKARE